MISKICSDACCGCSACYAICPKHAITMRENQKGFLSPEIAENCIECKLCTEICRMKDEFHSVKRAYIGNLKDEEKLMRSQSGGAFTAIAEEILKKNGVIYGAALDENFEAVHIRADNLNMLERLKGSKYMQSRMEDILLSVEEDLKQERIVLFSGTPCQISGVYKALKCKKIDLTNLYTVDLICHGVPSVLIWRDLLKYYEKKNSLKITKTIFRSKHAGAWGTHIGVYTFSDNSTLNTTDHTKLFYNNLALRDSCYRCKYARPERVGDITIGDAWGIKDKNPERYDVKGVSLLLLNQQKAEWLFSELNLSMNLLQVNYSDYLQPPLRKVIKPHRNPDEFWTDYHQKNFRFILRKYAENNVFLNWKYVLKRLVKIHDK